MASVMNDRYGTAINLSELEINLPHNEQYEVEAHAVDPYRDEYDDIPTVYYASSELIILSISVKNIGSGFECGWTISMGTRIVKSYYFYEESLEEFEKKTENLKKALNCYHYSESLSKYLREVVEDP